MTEEQQQSYGKDQVVKLINSVLHKFETQSEMSGEVLMNELRELKKVIDDARAELGAARATDIQDKFIPSAADELDAIVESTAEATGTIMDSCEKIQEYAAKAGGQAGSDIEDEVTKIYEACAFQDLTGQRITKVVTTLQQIDTKVSALLGVMGDAIPTGKSDEDSRSGDEALLNGPQLKGQGVSQEEIDKMLEDLF